MKIAVCVKRTPDTETRIKIAADGRSIDDTGVKFVLNPYDEYAVEEALALKEASGEGEVVVVSLGDAATQETIRTALAMGADRGVLLTPTGSADDPYVVARALADELQSGGFDLIVFGKVAIDDYQHGVGVMVAELLDLPCVSAVSSLAVADGAGTAQREIEGAVEVVEFSLPAVVTADKGLNEPRYPALRGIMMAKKKPLETKEVALADGGLEVTALTLPPARAEGRIVGEGADAVPALHDGIKPQTYLNRLLKDLGVD